MVARRLGLPLAPVVPARLCPLPSPLYTVLLGYKESPVAEARLRFGAMVRALAARVPARPRRDRLEALLGGPIDLVALVPSTHRPGPAPLALVDGLADEVAGALPAARWAAGLLRRAGAPGGSPPVAHMRPDPAAFTCRRRTGHGRRRRPGAASRRHLRQRGPVPERRRRVARGPAPRTVIAPLGRVLRPDRIALHADFLRRHAA